MISRTRSKVRAETLERRLVGVRVAGEILGCHADLVRELCRKGALPVVRYGRDIKLDLRDIEAFIQRHKTVGSLVVVEE